MNKNERLLLNGELLKTFVTIVECGNLTAAANLLNRTQSAISVQIQKLEVGLGVELFGRTSRGMTLTSAGEKLLPRARSILSEVKQTSAIFSEPLTGSIRVGIPDDFDDNALERILADFAKNHPGVDVIATSGCTSCYPLAIRNNDLDVAVYSGPDNHEGELLSTERVVWAAKKGFCVEKDAPLPLAILERSCWWRDAPIKCLSTAGMDYTIAFRSNSFTSLRAAIRAGFAVGILPASSVCENMIVLSKAQGFPALPTSRRTILKRPEASQDLVDAMAEAIMNVRGMGH